MGKPYDLELERLSETYAWALTVDVQRLSAAVRRVAPLPLVAVGSGGSFTVAEAVAGFHRDLCGTAGFALTPLEAVASGMNLRRAAILMTTAGGRNPDVLGSFERLARREPRRQIVLCLSTGSPLARRAARFPFVDFFEFEAPVEYDGFLATNSLLASVVLLSRAYAEAWGGKSNLPQAWNSIISRSSIGSLDRRLRPAWEKQTLVILHGPTTRAAATDLESRFTEAALGNVWTADYRHFAHGRHHWLAKRALTSAVLAFVTPDDDKLASETLALLPSDVPVIREDLPFSGIAASIAGLTRAIYIAGSAGNARGIDPGRPGVPSFGRRIYHLNAFRARHRTAVACSDEVAIERKAGKSLEVLKSAGVLNLWRRAYAAFVARLEAASFNGVVFDYDGTLCGEEDRFGALRADIGKELTRLVKAGIVLGIATGRGKSVRKTLREAVPRTHWQRVVIGYYNGGDVALLSDESKPDGTERIDEVLNPVANVLMHHPVLKRFASFELRPRQIKVEVAANADVEWIWTIMQQVVHGLAVPGVSMLRSSHSIDVLAPGVDKRVVISRVADLAGAPGGPVLCVGDQGAYPGNDYLLLASPYAISVDQVSTDPATCWNLAAPGVRCADASLEYLRRLRASRGVATFS